VSISYAIGAILGGAFALTIAQALIQSTGSSAIVSLYLLGMTLLSITAVLILPDRPSIDLSIKNQAEQGVGATVFDKRREPAHEKATGLAPSTTQITPPVPPYPHEHRRG
jgi:hypothetical protein